MINQANQMKAAVIGGGPSGIQAAGELMKQNFHVTLFERHPHLGGTWAYARNKTIKQPAAIPGIKPALPKQVAAVYQELRTNVPFQSMAIDGFAIPQPEDIRYAHHSEIHAYLHAYITYLEQKYPHLLTYRLNTTIESVSYQQNWHIRSRAFGHTSHDKFDVVIVATGPFQQPLTTNLHDPEFTGDCFHSMYYDDPAVLNNRTVLIVGGKNSARDIFWDAIERAKHVVIATPAKQDRNNLILLENGYHHLQDKFTSIGRVRRIQQDGSVAYTNWQGEDEVLTQQKVDMVIYCTGYKREFPFLSQALQPATRSSRNDEVSNCLLFTAHKKHPHTLFFFHPLKARTPFNTMARDTHAQAKLIAALAAHQHLTLAQLTQLDKALQNWLRLLYTEWAKETLNSCPCAAQNPFLMNFLNTVASTQNAFKQDDDAADISKQVLDQIRKQMKEKQARRQNAIWHAGMNLRTRADAVNWNIFRFLRGKVTGGPDIDGRDFYEVTWFEENGRKHSTFNENDILYESLIINASD